MSREVRSYNDLIAWQKGISFVTQIYACTSTFPREEMYGLTSQLRRAAVSIPSNIAEGHGRMTTGEYLHFLGNARGSLFEVRTQIHIAKELKFLNDE
jgi:four helix bundle protein